jgi:putative aldouronate transport system permease protein
MPESSAVVDYEDRSEVSFVETTEVHMMIGLKPTNVAQPSVERPVRRTRQRSNRDDLMLYLLALPGVIFFLVFSYGPMAGIVVAFKNFDISDGIFNSPWNGFQNFAFFFTSNDAPHVLFNTLFLNALFIIGTTVASVWMAIFLNEIRLRTFKRVLQSSLLLPYFMSWVVISMMLQEFIGGISGNPPLVTQWLSAIHLQGIDWYLTPNIWPAILTIVKVWQGAGYLSIIYLAAITSIPEEVYEAARIDGSSSAQMAWRITFPLLIPTILILLLLSVGRIFYGDFGMIYAIVGDNGVLFPTTDVIDTYVFRALREYGDFGMTAAVGLFQSVVGFVLVVIANWVARRYSPDTALF